jgi:hypothetical protein
VVSAGPALNLRGALNGYVIECDGHAIAEAASFLQAATLLRQFRAVRFFAAEELRCVLSKQSQREA